MYRSKIVGTGFYVPPRVVTNHDLEKLMDTSDEWIQQRTGIRERHYAENGVGAADLAYEAAKRALDSAGMKIEDIDFIVFATLSPDYTFPGSGVLLQHYLGARNVGALDVRDQCTGFLYSLMVADNAIKVGQYKNVLVVGAEVHSTGLDFSTEGRDVTVLFGDGAGAVILTATEEKNKGILSTHLHSDGKYANKLWVEWPSSRRMPRVTHKILDEGKHFPKMDGQFVFMHAVKRMVEVIGEALEYNGFNVDDIGMIIPHQANLRINQMVARKLKIPDEKMFNNIQKYGNTTAATIPIALTEALQEGRIKDGDLVIMASFGAGFTWASAAMIW